MGLNEKITEKYEVTADNSEQDILTAISLGKQKDTWTHFLMSDSVDFKEISIVNGRIKIMRGPLFLDVFRSSGKITIEMVSLPNKGTLLKCEVLPYQGNLPIFLGLLIAVLTLWTLIVVAFGRDYNALLMILMAWGMFGGFSYLTYLLTKHGLVNYSRKVIREITKDKKVSR